MAKKTSQNSFPNDFWVHSKLMNGPHSRLSSSLKKQALSTNAFLYPIDESDEFYDPFSELNLFLSKKIKQEIEKGPIQTWSSKLHEELIKKILPEFKHKFPKYHLGESALKRTWEKVCYFHNKLHSQRHLYRHDGTLNLEKMIQESLKSCPNSNNYNGLHPYNLSHQLAVKLSECIATLDGVRPDLDQLTKTIWAMQKHLMDDPIACAKAPFESHDLLDKLIVRQQLQITATDKPISRQDLHVNLKEQIERYELLSSIKSLGELRPIISAILAKTMRPHLSLSKTLSKKRLVQIEQFIRKQTKRCIDQYGSFTKANKPSIAHRILTLYPIATHLPKQLAKKQLDASIKYVYSLSTNVFAPISPMINQAMLSFINAEIVSLKEKKEIGALEKVLTTLLTIFQDAQDLPKLSPKQLQELEVWIWSIIEEEDKSLSKVSAGALSLIEEEIAHIMIDSQKFDFQVILQKTLHFFKRINELDFFTGFFKITNDSKALKAVDNKIYLWSIQNDMICKLLQFGEKSYIQKAIFKKLKANDQNITNISPSQFIQEILDTLLKEHSHLKPVSEHLEKRIWIMVKYLYFTDPNHSKASSLQCFIDWQVLLMKEQNVSDQKLKNTLEQLCELTLPLLPNRTTNKELHAICG